MKVKLTDVRISFTNLFEAKTVNGEGDPRFSAVFIIEPGSANAKALKAAVEATAKEKWGAKAPGILAELVKKDRVCYAERAKTNQSGDVYDGFEGKHFVNSSNKARPLVIDRDKTPLAAADGKPYAGSFVNATIDLWAQDNNYGKRINASLMGVQFYRDGDAFAGGGVANPDDFDDLGAGADADFAAEESLV